MSRRLSILYLYVLGLLAGTSELRAFATEVSHGAQYYGNDTNLVPSEDLSSPFPYDFPNYKHLDNLFPMPDCNGLVLEEATVDYLQNAMKKGKLTSTMVALCYFQRIYQTNEYTK